MAAKEPHNMEQVEDRGHGAHGKGDERETVQDPAPTLPGNARDAKAPRAGQAPDEATSHLSDAGWGSGGAGGSVADKRSPKPRKGDAGTSEG